MAPEHRIVLFEKIGPGSHPCHWCGKVVEWAPGRRTAAGALVVDHMDNDGRNNDPSNLVPSCHTCNWLRSNPGHAIEDGEPFIVYGDGTRTRAKTKQCERCGKEFLCRLTPESRGRGRFCSISCGKAGSRPAPRSSNQLTDDDVRRMRSLWAEGGHSQDELGAMFGVSSSMACMIVNGKRYRHVQPID